METIRNDVASGLLCVIALTGAIAGAPVFADRYPDRPVRLIVPFPPGGSTDFNARAIQDKFSELLGQQLVIDNRGGASGQIGTRLVKDSDPNGYTLVLHTVAFLTSPIIYTDAGYDPFKDFRPISLISKIPTAVSVHPSVPARSVKELLALTKARPGAINYASSGVGTNSHLTGELFNLMGHVDMRAIQYKGGGPALAAVVGGEMQVGFSNITNTARLQESGRLRALAVSGLKRSTAMPELPTVAEAGLPGFEMVAWHFIAVPARTPDAIVRTLNQKLLAVLADSEVLKRFEKGGADVVPTTPQEATSYMKSEMEKWRKVVKERNIKAE